MNEAHKIVSLSNNISEAMEIAEASLRIVEITYDWNRDANFFQFNDNSVLVVALYFDKARAFRDIESAEGALKAAEQEIKRQLQQIRAIV